MGIKEIEDEIIAEIAKYITTLKVEGFPDNTSTYNLIHPKGAVLVAYNGSDFSEPRGYENIMQVENLDFSITVVVKGLRDKFGAYTFLDTLKTTLTKFLPTDCTLSYINSINFLSEENGEWQYGLSYLVTKEHYE